jgi:hypothetical protein
LYQSPSAEVLPELDVPPPSHQRRLTVFFRWLLLIPQFIVLWVLGIVTFFAAIAAWFAALALGRLPRWAAGYLSGYVVYSTRVSASLYLLTDRYPPFAFTAPEYPVQVELHPGGPLNRLAVLFRIILAIPAIIIASVVATGWSVLAFFSWLVVFILGRMPEPLFEATAAIVRYSMRLAAYFLMVTPAYPKRLFGDPAGSGPAAGYDPNAPAGGYDPNFPAAGYDPGAPARGYDPNAAAGGYDPGISAGGYSPAVPAGGYAAGDPVGSYAAAPAAAGRSATRPLLLATGGKVLLVVFIVVGLLGAAGEGIGGGSGNAQQTPSTTTQP